MAELEISELPGRPLLEERVKDYPKVQWLLGKYADKAYPIIDKHDIEAVLTELLDDMDRWKGAYNTMKINFNNECDSHAADTERNENRIKELEQIKFKYEFGKHFGQIHSFLFELDFWDITELIGEEFDKKLSFRSKEGCFVLNCKLAGDTEIYKIKRLSEPDYFVECGFDTIFSELEKLENTHCCYCDSQSVRIIRGFTYSGIEHLVCEAHLNDLKAKITHDSDIARRMIEAHGIESITDVVPIEPSILNELLYTNNPDANRIKELTDKEK